MWPGSGKHNKGRQRLITKYFVLFSHRKCEMWLGSGKHAVKEGMIEIIEERIAINQSLLGIVNGLEVESTQSKKGL